MSAPGEEDPWEKFREATDAFERTMKHFKNDELDSMAVDEVAYYTAFNEEAESEAKDGDEEREPGFAQIKWATCRC